MLQHLMLTTAQASTGTTTDCCCNGLHDHVHSTLAHSVADHSTLVVAPAQCANSLHTRYCSIVRTTSHVAVVDQTTSTYTPNTNLSLDFVNNSFELLCCGSLLNTGILFKDSNRILISTCPTLLLLTSTLMLWVCRGVAVEPISVHLLAQQYGHSYSCYSYC
jgi:hypothetical protein